MRGEQYLEHIKSDHLIDSQIVSLAFPKLIRKNPIPIWTEPLRQGIGFAYESLINTIGRMRSGVKDSSQRFEVFG